MVKDGSAEIEAFTVGNIPQYVLRWPNLNFLVYWFMEETHNQEIVSLNPGAEYWTHILDINLL